MEEEPEWLQPQSCRAEAADQGTTAPPGDPRAPSILWVSPQAVPARPAQVSCPGAGQSLCRRRGAATLSCL